jgi:hypothetical protein
MFVEPVLPTVRQTHVLGSSDVRRVEQLLTLQTGARPRVVAQTRLGTDWTPVVRITLDQAVGDIGQTLVVKRRPLENPSGRDSSRNLSNEPAALRLLTELPARISPAVIAFDDKSGLLLMTDLGNGPTVEAVLHSRDAATAYSALLGLGRATGALHGATIGRAGAWGIAEDRQRMFHLGIDCWDALCAAVAASDFPKPDHAANDFGLVLNALREPEPVLALTHSDLTPSNGVLTGNGVALVDFEDAAFRHFGLDAALLRFPFPQYRHWATLPRSVGDAMLGAYRDELKHAWAGASDDRQFATVLAVGCAAVVVIRTLRLERVADPSQPPQLARRRRIQLVHTVDTFVESAHRAGVFTELAAWFSELAWAMRDRWSEAKQPPPIYHAFEG